MTAPVPDKVWPMCSRCGVRSPDVHQLPIHRGLHLVGHRRPRRGPLRGLFCDHCARGRPFMKEEPDE